MLFGRGASVTTLAVACAALALLPVGCSAAGTPPGPGVPQPAGYAVDARWSPSGRVLSGAETIRVRNAGPGTLPLIWLRLWANDSIPGEADGCRDPGIEVRGLEGATVTRHAVACSALALRLSRPLAPGDVATVRLRFKIRVPDVEAQFGRSAGVDLLGRALPVLAVRDTAGWHLNPDTETGDPGVALAAPWSATIRVPADLDVASTGAVVSSTVDRRRRERAVAVETPHAREFGLAIGRLTRREAVADGVRVRVFSSSAVDRADAERALRNGVKALRTFTGWFGPYGSPELDLVVTDLGDASQEIPELVFTDPDRATVAHEVAHQWWFAIVGDDQYDEPWLDEAFAAWSEEQLAPGTYECDPSDPLGAHRGELTRGLSYFEARPERYVDVVYEGGECALTALERMLGRDRFLDLLRSEVARYRYGVVHTGDFMALLRAADPAVAARWAKLVGIPLR